MALDASGRPTELEHRPEEGPAFIVREIRYRGDSRTVDRVTVEVVRDGVARATTYRREGQGLRWSRIRDGRIIGSWTGDIAINPDNEYAFREGTGPDRQGRYHWTVFDHTSGRGHSVIQYPNGEAVTLKPEEEQPPATDPVEPAQPVKSPDLEAAKETMRSALATALAAEGITGDEAVRRVARAEQYVAQFETRELRLARLREQYTDGDLEAAALSRVHRTLDHLNRLLTDPHATVFERNARRGGKPVVSRAELFEQALFHYSDVTTVDQSWNACQMATAERSCMWYAPDALAGQAVETILTGSFKTVDGHVVNMPYAHTLAPGAREQRFDLDRETGPGYRSPWNQIVQHMIGNAYNAAHRRSSVYRSQHGWVNSQTAEASRLVTGHATKYRWDYGRDWRAALRRGELLGTTGHGHAWAYVPELRETEGRVVVRTYIDDNSYGERRDVRRSL